MNANDKLSGLLGMARRAGQLTVGFDASVGAIAGGKSGLLLLATDVSPKTAKECRFAAEAHTAHVRMLPLDKQQLAAAIGSSKPVGVIAVCDRGFSKAICAYCPESKEE